MAGLDFVQYHYCIRSTMIYCTVVIFAALQFILYSSKCLKEVSTFKISQKKMQMAGVQKKKRIKNLTIFN